MSNNTISEVLKIFKNEWNKQVILYGPPGTSKTYSSTIIAAAMLVGKNVPLKDIFECEIEDKYDVSGFIDENGELKEDELKKALKSIVDKVDLGKIKDDRLKGKVENTQSSEKLDLYELSSVYEELTDNYKLVQFHPSYSYEDFVRGITVKPDGKNGVSYVTESKILETFSEVKGDKVLVIDEINRAPLASVLGELIYGLEYRGNNITTPYKIDDKELKIPNDLYIIGTMNTADRSIGSIDYAVRRRFAFVQVPSNDTVIEDSWENIGKDVEKLYKWLMNGVKNDEVDKGLDKVIEDIKDNGLKGIFDKEKFLEDQELDVNDIKIGHTYFLGDKDKCKDASGNVTQDAEFNYLNYRIDYQIRPIYEEYKKDGIINQAGLDEFDKIVELWRVTRTSSDSEGSSDDATSGDKE